MSPDEIQAIGMKDRAHADSYLGVACREIDSSEMSNLLKRTRESSGEGRASVAGVAFPIGIRWKPKHFLETDFRDIDLSFSRMWGNVLSPLTFRGCSFRNAVYDEASCIRAHFYDCTFEKVCFGQGYGGLLKMCRFENCTFTNCVLNFLEFRKTLLICCHLLDVTSDRTSWDGCTFKDVHITGTLKSPRFGHCRFQQLEMADSHLVDCFIYDSKELRLTLPDRPNNFCISPSVLVLVDPIMKERLSGPGYKTYSEIAAVLTASKRAERECIDDTLFDQVLPDDRLKIVETLYQHRQASPPEGDHRP